MMLLLLHQFNTLNVTMLRFFEPIHYIITAYRNTYDRHFQRLYQLPSLLRFPECTMTQIRFEFR